MRAKEFINLERAGGFHTPYESDDDAAQGKNWSKLSPQQQSMWTQRQKQLLARAQRIYAKLLATMDEQHRALLKGYNLIVPIKAAVYQIAYNWKDKKEIALDLGTFWDMSDDSIAYTIGHELGHSVGWGSGKYNPKEPWNTPALKRKKVQEELDADTYGALLAYKAGYDHKHALQEFDAEARSWRYDPNIAGQNYYPDYRMRQANLKKNIAQAEKDKAQAAELQKQQQPTQSNAPTEPIPQQPTAPSQPQVPNGQDAAPAPNDGTNPQLNSAHQEIFNHISRGIRNMEILAQQNAVPQQTATA